MDRKRGGGRPYNLGDRQRFAELIRQHGARGAREKLARKVCVATLLKIAVEFGIELKKGRRPASCGDLARPPALPRSRFVSTNVREAA